MLRLSQFRKKKEAFDGFLFIKNYFDDFTL